jgi:hypothetical protein|tara:strand:- start:548 stop:865 length:318 start_codon:yes stop_codon:yes gene_type:complete
MSLRTLDKKTLLSSVSASGAGSSFSVERSKGWTFVIATESAGAATVDIEAYIGGSWHVVHSQSVSAEGSVMVRDDHGHYEKLRGNVSAYTAGTHSLFATGTVDSL